MKFLLVTGILFLVRWILKEIRNAPLMPDCYGSAGCFGDCDLCRVLRPERFEDGKV